MVYMSNGYAENCMLTVVSQSGQECTQINFVDAYPGEECIFTTEPIAEASHTELPLPEEWGSVCQLACGHRFSTINLMAWWLQRAMLCPVCRSGVDERISEDTFPLRMREKVHSFVAEKLKNDDNDELQERRTLILQEVTQHLETVFNTGEDLLRCMRWCHVQLIVYLHRGPRVISSTQFPLYASHSDWPQSVHFCPQRQSTRSFNRQISESGVHKVSVKIVVSSADLSSVMELASFPLLPIYMFRTADTDTKIVAPACVTLNISNGPAVMNFAPTCELSIDTPISAILEHMTPAIVTGMFVDA